MNACIPRITVASSHLLARAGKSGEALEVFGWLAQRASGDPAAHQAYGVALAQAGRFAEALREFERTLALDPAFPGARQLLQNAREDVAKPAP